jgi:hypothetical protein
VFLERSSAQAVPYGDGSWGAASDPFVSMTSGFELHAALRAKPDLSASARLDPDYTCLPHAWSFRGRTGRAGEAGGDGPDVTVRVAVVRSPTYPRLLVAAFEVGEGLPFYYVADAAIIQPRDWLIVETRGGRGGRGTDGPKGTAGTAGTQGCPGTPGGPGGNGGNGGSGGSGGRGGRMTIITAAEEPFLAGIVDARNAGGEGGEGGKGGAGGAGGKGGAAIRPECAAGPDGQAGAAGAAGRDGVEGRPGLRPQVVTVPLADVFGTRIPPELAQLLAPPPPPRR